MLKRLFRVIRAMFGWAIGKAENPEILLEQAREDLQANLERNRQRTIAAITERNRLQKEYERLQKQADDAQRKAEMALRNGDRDLARSFLIEKKSYEQALESLQVSLATANQQIAQIKAAMQQEELNVRKRTAEILAQKTRWKSAQIQNSINDALQGIGTDDVSRDLERANDKITRVEAEAAAKAEMASESLAGRSQRLETDIRTMEAEEELRELEAKMQGGGARTQSTQSVSVGEMSPAASDSIEASLQELERSINKPSSGDSS